MKHLKKPNLIEQNFEDVNAFCDFSCPNLSCKCGCDDHSGANDSIETEEDILF